MIKNTHPDQIQSTTPESEQQSSESELKGLTEMEWAVLAKAFGKFLCSD